MSPLTGGYKALTSVAVGRPDRLEIYDVQRGKMKEKEVRSRKKLKSLY